MPKEPVSHKPISRRDFLKMGCATAAAAGLMVCGVSAFIPDPDPSPIDLPSFSFGGGTMKNRVLVTYASALGSTAEVAAAIGETLATGGPCVDIKPIKENPKLEGYQAVLIGSAIQHGKWLPDAVEFVTTNQEALNHVPVALFTVHIMNLGNDEKSRQKRMAYLNEVRPLLHPVDETFFAGKFDRHGAALLLPGMLARFIPSMDYRNWEKIKAWAAAVQPKLVGQLHFTALA